MSLPLDILSIFVTVVIIASATSCLYALGLWLWYRGTDRSFGTDDSGGSAFRVKGRIPINPSTLGSLACFAACVVVGLFALYIAFH